MRAQKKKRPRGVVDTSVLVAGIAGFRTRGRQRENASAALIREWIERDTFVWLLTDEILQEYKSVLGRLGVRRPLIGKVINLLREEAEAVFTPRSANISPDPGDDPFCACAEQGHADFIVTLNQGDFPQRLLSAHVISPEEEIPTTGRRKKPQRAR